jgi:uncharacterized protein YbbC (DUF1343 family)
MNALNLPVLFSGKLFSPTFHKGDGQICEGHNSSADRQVFESFEMASDPQVLLHRNPQDIACKQPPYEYEIQNSQ